MPPISLSSTYKQIGLDEHSGYEYSRTANPSRKVLEECLASLDNGKYALAFASGLGTLTAIISMLNSGDGIITNDDQYSGSLGLFKSMAVNMKMDMQFIDLSDLRNLEKAIKPNVKMVWMETPTNPTMKVIDIRAVAEIVHSKSDAFLVVDNTLLSAYFQRPLDLGADIVMHSLTKYMNGHSDVVMGSIALNDENLFKKLKFYQNATGIVPSPFDCFLVNRGLKTLSIRMERHFENSVAVARFLEAHPKVDWVRHPALPSHPQHKIALSQSYGHSGILAFHIKDATMEKQSAFLKALKLAVTAVSLGGYETLIEVPKAMMRHAAVPEGHRDKYGVDDGLVRLSVGLEDAQDLINDLDQALAFV